MLALDFGPPELDRYTPPSGCFFGASPRRCAPSTAWRWREGAGSARPYCEVFSGFKGGSFAFVRGRSSDNQALQATAGHRVLRFVLGLLFLCFVPVLRWPAAPERQAVMHRRNRCAIMAL